MRCRVALLFALVGTVGCDSGSLDRDDTDLQGGGSLHFATDAGLPVDHSAAPMDQDDGHEPGQDGGPRSDDLGDAVTDPSPTQQDGGTAAQSDSAPVSLDCAGKTSVAFSLGSSQGEFYCYYDVPAATYGEIFTAIPAGQDCSYRGSASPGNPFIPGSFAKLPNLRLECIGDPAGRPWEVVGPQPVVPDSALYESQCDYINPYAAGCRCAGNAVAVWDGKAGTTGGRLLFKGCKSDLSGLSLGHGEAMQQTASAEMGADHYWGSGSVTAQCRDGELILTDHVCEAACPSKVNSTCESRTPCPVDYGVGEQRWTAKGWSRCEVVSCDAGDPDTCGDVRTTYLMHDDACTPVTTVYAFFPQVPPTDPYADHFFTASCTEGINTVLTRDGKRIAIARQKDKDFRAFKEQKPGTRALYRCSIQRKTPGAPLDHFLSISPTCEWTATLASIETKGRLGYVFDDARTGFVPLVRCYNTVNGDHLATTSPSIHCGDTKSWRREHTLGWVLKGR